MSHLKFYENLPPLKHFSEFTNCSHYFDLPEDWYVVITDIVNSTKAIEKGKYKDVNMASVLSLVAVRNINPHIDLPFVFGGDGITLLIPRQMLADVLSVLSDNRNFVKNTFSLLLRVGFISVREIYQSSYELKVAKYQVSPTYSQVMIIGNGIDYAEFLVKSPQHSGNYLIPEDYQSRKSADYSGFSCPFKDVNSHREEIISVIIRVRNNDFKTQNILYQQIIEQIEFIFGSLQECHPLAVKQIKFININSDRAKALSKVLFIRQTGIYKQMKILMLKLALIFQPIYLKILHYLFQVKNQIIVATDYKKFDGTLKMTLSCYPEQRKKFQAYLQKLKQENKIYFGLHTSNRVLITCLLGSHEVHLVDCADGGYALAAKQLKKQLAIDN
ncbi:MAG: DUF3095 family protein [Nostocaceae cyanobacterium]|nr:DUF3095 family protein [Nostocaceae cyanobacterium]